MIKTLIGAICAGALLAAAPVAAQLSYSDSFSFLKAVKEQDGAKVASLIATPGTIVINSRDRENGEGALHYMVRERNHGWLAYLLGKKARPDLQNKQGDTPLSLAAQMGWVEGAQLLLAKGATVDLPNGRGETPLIRAAQKRDMPMVRVLLASGADPKRTDSAAGYSASDYARQDPRGAAILKLLLAPAAAKPAAAGPKL